MPNKYHPQFVPLTGTFGKWTVVTYLRKSAYLCECECGIRLPIDSSTLKSGERTMCRRCKSGYPEGFCDSYSAYKCNAKKRNLSFSLSKDRALYLMQLPCTYCGEIPTKYSGIDRRDNSQGYDDLNCVSCCSQCNHMKCDWTVEEFLARVKKIGEHNA